jgi:hypothetical protein
MLATVITAIPAIAAAQTMRTIDLGGGLSAREERGACVQYLCTDFDPATWRCSAMTPYAGAAPPDAGSTAPVVVPVASNVAVIGSYGTYLGGGCARWVPTGFVFGEQPDLRASNEAFRVMRSRQVWRL